MIIRPLIFHLLIVLSLIFSHVIANEFKTNCQKLTDGKDIKAIYYRSTCFVYELTSVQHDAAICNHLHNHEGYLALLPGNHLVAKMFTAFEGHMPAKSAWIGLKRNQTTHWKTSPPKSREFWYWEVMGQNWYAPSYATHWATNEPNEGGLTCGELYKPPKALANVYCTYKKNILCQYRSHQLKFKHSQTGVRGSPSETFEETAVEDPAMCSHKCAHVPLCQSYTVNENNGFCALHMLPVIELNIEQLNGGDLYDLDG